MKSTVFQHIFNYVSTYVYVFPEYLLHKFEHEIMQKMQSCLCYWNKYNEIKMYDLERFSEIQSHT